MLLVVHLALVTSLLEYRHDNQKERRVSTGVEDLGSPCLWTIWDKVYVAGAGVVWVFGELVHPRVFGEGTLPFLPLMGMSVFGAIGVLACWVLSAVATPSAG